MARCIDSYELIICPECAAKVIYDDRDIQVLTSTSCDFLSFENKVQQTKVIKCPKCYKTIMIETIKPFTIGVDLAKEKDMGGISW